MNYKNYYLNQAGGQYNVFRGVARQRGYGLGGMFKSMFRYILPLFKSHALPVIRRGAEAIGTEAVRAASNIATDAIKGEDIKQSFQHHANSAIENLSTQAKNRLQSGSGRKRLYRKRENSIKSPVKRKVSFNTPFQKNKIRRIADIFD